MDSFTQSLKKKNNEEQIITGYPIDGAMGSSGGGRVRKLLVVIYHILSYDELKMEYGTIKCIRSGHKSGCS